MTHFRPSQNPVLPAPGEQLCWSGIHGSGLGLAISRAARNATGLLVIVLEDQHKLEILETEIRYFLADDPEVPVSAFPGWECLPYDVFSPHEEIISNRLKLLAGLPVFNRGVLLILVSDLMQRLPPTGYVLGHSFSLQQGERIDTDKLREQLITANYTAVNQVIAPGEFAVRGGLIDIFPMGQVQPFRLDLMDDEIETIRLFDPESQRSSDYADNIKLLPAREFPMNEEGIRQFRSAFRRHIEGDPRTQSIYNEISNGMAPAGIDFYFPLFFEETATFFDYIKSNSILVTVPEFDNAISENWAMIVDRHQNASVDIERKVLGPDLLYLDPKQVHKWTTRFAGISIMHDPEDESCWHGDTKPNRQFPVDPRKDNAYTELLDHLGEGKNRVMIAVETPGRLEAIEGVLRGNGLDFSETSHFNQFIELADVRLGVAIAPLERGLTSPDAGLEIICESQLYGERVYQRRRRSQQSRDPDTIIKSLAELNIGDPVVHLEHGVGRYRGLQLLEIAGEQSEFLTIEYQNGDKLYLPILSLNLVSRFIGGSPELAPLHRLGGDQWEKSKQKARTKAYDVATELLEIEALRNARKGRTFSVDPVDLESFCGRFPFEETPDQQQVIEEVLDDLKSVEPMDRLVCGDVGFGKTEIALRAAFVVANSGRQVAVLTPTTLLAQQHYHTFLERFSDWPIRIALLSRFKSRSEIQEIVDELKSGKVDIVIGTHRLLQDDIAFSELGLLVIDEEHRFGVRQKERIKRLRSQVDILTLTATPIPRTLNITMAGLRSISIVATPPANRLSIKTFVREWNLGLIREACLREIRRGGQVFFLHNDVRSIERMAQELGELVPEAEINIGHGQMRELELERIMQDFYHQRFNLLVCSTIIESGIDIPSANTIIINRADRFGLAQLHQLRGRVGRSNHQAFAYLLIPSRESISTNARKRLEAIDSMEDLGAGFALASHDLEIRGAGELLGETQSGLIDDIGFSLYSEYLSQAVRSIKEGRLPEPSSENLMVRSSSVDLHLAALFPRSYLDNAHTRLVMYKRIASSESLEELKELQIETIDRFGLMPEEGKNLFRLTELRLTAEKLDISKIDVGEEGGIIEFHDDPLVDPAVVFKLINESPHQYKLAGPNAFRITRELSDHEARIDAVSEILTGLAETLC